MEESSVLITTILSVVVVCLEITKAILESKNSNEPRVIQLYKNKKVRVSFWVIIILCFIPFLLSLFQDRITTYEVNDGNPLHFKSTDTIYIKRKGGKRSSDLFVAIDKQIIKYEKNKKCSCWMLDLEDFSNLEQGGHLFMIGNNKEWVLQNYETLSEKIYIDDILPNVNLNLEKRNFKNGKIDLLIRGLSNEEVNIKLNLPIEGDDYRFSSTIDSTNGKIIHSFTYDIFDIDIPEDSLLLLKDFIIEVSDLAENSIIRKEDPETFFKTGKYTWSLKGNDLSIEKNKLEYNSVGKNINLGSDYGEREAIPDDILRLTVTLVSSKKILVNWHLKEQHDHVKYTVYRDGQILAKDIERNDYYDDNIIRDSTYIYGVEAVINNETFARSSKVTQTAWIVVSKRGDGDFEVIQEAIDFVAPNSTILVKNGIYKENSGHYDKVVKKPNYTRSKEKGLANIIINKPIRLLGENAQSTIIDSYNALNGIYLNSALGGVTIENFKIIGSGRNKLATIGAAIRIDNQSWWTVNGPGNIYIRNIMMYDCEAGVRASIERNTFFSNLLIVDCKGKLEPAINLDVDNYEESAATCIISNSVIYRNDLALNLKTSSYDRYDPIRLIKIENCIFNDNGIGLSSKIKSICNNCNYGKPTFISPDNFVIKGHKNFPIGIIN